MDTEKHLSNNFNCKLMLLQCICCPCVCTLWDARRCGVICGIATAIDTEKHPNDNVNCKLERYRHKQTGKPLHVYHIVHETIVDD